MLDIVIPVLLLLAVVVTGCVLYRRHNREASSPTIDRETRAPKPRTGLFGDQSGHWP